MAWVVSGIVFGCAYLSTCTDIGTYLYEERHRQNWYIVKSVHSFRLKTRKYQ